MTATSALRSAAPTGKRSAISRRRKGVMGES
jgi:hypothetical protein